MEKAHLKTKGSFVETASEREAVRIETPPSETVTAEFAYGFIYIDEPIFGRADINDDGDFNDSEEQFYYTTNNLYCVTAILDTSGNIIERYEYTSYGELTVYTDASSGTWWDGDETSGSLSGNYYSFTGRRSDPEADLMYYRNRYYSAELGRFVSRDPKGHVDGLNIYNSYFVPLGMDPLGMTAAGFYWECCRFTGVYHIEPAVTKSPRPSFNFVRDVIFPRYVWRIKWTCKCEQACTGTAAWVTYGGGGSSNETFSRWVSVGESAPVFFRYSDYLFDYTYAVGQSSSALYDALLDLTVEEMPPGDLHEALLSWPSDVFEGLTEKGIERFFHELLPQAEWRKQREGAKNDFEAVCHLVCAGLK